MLDGREEEKKRKKKKKKEALWISENAGMGQPDAEGLDKNAAQSNMPQLAWKISSEDVTWATVCNSGTKFCWCFTDQRTLSINTQQMQTYATLIA